MKERKLYWSRKRGKLIAECKIKNNTIYLFTLPSIENLAKSCLFTKEKSDKIMHKINRADIKDSKVTKPKQDVRTNAINSPFSNHDEINKQLHELTK